MNRRAITYIIINKKNRAFIYYSIEANYTSQELSYGKKRTTLRTKRLKKNNFYPYKFANMGYNL